MARWIPGWLGGPGGGADSGNLANEGYSSARDEGGSIPGYTVAGGIQPLPGDINEADLLPGYSVSGGLDTSTGFFDSIRDFLAGNGDVTGPDIGSRLPSNTTVINNPPPNFSLPPNIPPINIPNIPPPDYVPGPAVPPPPVEGLPGGGIPIGPSVNPGAIFDEAPGSDGYYMTPEGRQAILENRVGSGVPNPYLKLGLGGTPKMGGGILAGLPGIPGTPAAPPKQPAPAPNPKPPTVKPQPVGGPVILNPNNPGSSIVPQPTTQPKFPGIVDFTRGTSGRTYNGGSGRFLRNLL